MFITCSFKRLALTFGVALCIASQSLPSYADRVKLPDLDSSNFVQLEVTFRGKNKQLACWIKPLANQKIKIVAGQISPASKGDLVWRSLKSILNSIEKRFGKTHKKSVAAREFLKLGQQSCAEAKEDPNTSPTPTPSLTPSPTPTPTPRPSETPSPSPTVSPTSTPTPTPTPSPTPTASPTPTVTPPISNSIELIVSTSQTGGPAPLAVSFDATASLGLANNDFVGATFIWDFGDASAPEWPVSEKSSNRARGFISGHVYPNPGTYYAKLRAIDAQGNYSAEIEIPITVSVPEQVYTQTFCVSTSGTDSSCAPGALPLSTMSQVIANSGPNKRFLFQRNYTATLSGPISFNNIQGPMYIGAYGNGDRPEFYSPATDIEAAIYINGSNDIRIEDIAFRGPDAIHASGAPIGLWIDSNRVLLNRVQILGFDRNIHYAGHAGSPERIGNFIVDSLLQDAGYFSVTTSTNFRHTNILGNDFSDSVQGHIRILESQKTNIAHNHFLGSFAIKSHSGQTVVVDNFFNGGTSSRIAYGTGGSNESCSVNSKMHHLLEGNMFWGISPSYSGGVAGANIECGGNFLVRANMFWKVPNAVSINAALFTSGFSGNLPVRIYNNYSGDDRTSTSASNFIRISTAYPATDIKNNFVYFPTLNFHDGDYTSAIQLQTSDTNNLVIDNNLWFMPASNGSNGNTPGLFIKTSTYPNHIGYSSTIAAPMNVQYFGSLLPISSWQLLGFDSLSIFSDPGALITTQSGRMALSPTSPANGAGDGDIPFFLDFYAEELPYPRSVPIGPFFIPSTH